MTADTLIYAELLSNIRQISVIAVLPIPSNNQTTVALSSDRQQIALQHGGQTTTLTLPGQVHPTAQLQLPALGKTELSWRLPLAGQPTRSEAPDVEAPWPAQGLEADLEISCRECRAVFVGKGTVKTWKDLPSENWAEMMEFWHCHKPDDEPSGHEGHDHSHSHTHDPNTSKGYGANSKFIAKAGLGFVDIQTFLLAESDCRNYEVSYFFVPFIAQHSSSLSVLPIPLCPGYQEGGQTISIAWSPIQTPKIEYSFQSALQQLKLSYPFLAESGCVCFD